MTKLIVESSAIFEQATSATNLNKKIRQQLSNITSRSRKNVVTHLNQDRDETLTTQSAGNDRESASPLGIRISSGQRSIPVDDHEDLPRLRDRNQLIPRTHDPIPPDEVWDTDSEDDTFVDEQDDVSGDSESEEEDNSGSARGGARGSSKQSKPRPKVVKEDEFTIKKVYIIIFGFIELI